MSNINSSIKGILTSILKFAGCILILGLIFNFGFNNKKNNVVEPKVPDKFVLKPTINLQNSALHAGTAFAAKIEGEKQPVIVTAIHIFGPAGGLKKDIPSTNLPKAVKNIELTDVFNGNNCGTVSNVLSIPNANYKYYKNDVAAFLSGKNTNVSPLKISSKIPNVGDNVWLAAGFTSEDNSKKQKLYRATVVESSDSILSYEYENNKLTLQATSGAPILNEKGEIVGINLGHKQDGDKLIGIANPCVSFKKMIVKAIFKTKK
jgi:hypothetical protein